MKKIIVILASLVMLACTACGNSNRSTKSNVTGIPTATTEPAVEAAANTTATTEPAEESTTDSATDLTAPEEVDIAQYKKRFLSGKWDGSPLFIGENVISIDSEKAEIWLNNAPISEPLYCEAAENESFSILGMDETFVYYYNDVKSDENRNYFILQVNKKNGDIIPVEIPERLYSSQIISQNVFIKAAYALYRVNFRVENPEPILINEVVSDYRVLDYSSSSILYYISGNRLEYGISFDKQSGAEENIEPTETTQARYSNNEGKVTFYDNELYSKARELYASKLWNGNFTDLHTLDGSIPENTFASINYNYNIVINNEVLGKYFRAIQVEPGGNVCGTFYGPEVVWLEDDFNQYLRFFFPGQKEDYCLHSSGTTLPFEIKGYTRMLAFFYESDLTTKVAGAHVYILTDGELWCLDCNFISESVKTHVVSFESHDLIDFNWAYDSLYYLLDNGEAYTIEYGDEGWDFKAPERFGGDRLFYALSHHTDEQEGALSFNEGNYGDSHLYSPYGE